MRAWVLVGVLVTVACGGGAQPEPAAEPEAPPSAGTIERLDPAFDALVPADAVIEELAGGFGFTEGPAWIDDEGGFLLFSDIPGNRIVRWDPDGTVSDFLNPVYEGEHEEGRLVGSNGIIVDPDGNVVFTEHFNGRIARIAADGTRSVVVDSYEGGRLNSPNDLDYHSDGSLYFTDPAYGLPSPEAREQDVNGIYRLSADGELVRLGRPDRPQRHRLLARRVAPLRGRQRHPAVDGVPGERGRHPRRGRAAARRQRLGGERLGRRPEDRRAGQPVGDGPRGASGSSRRTERISARSSRTRCRPTWRGATRTGARCT